MPQPIAILFGFLFTVVFCCLLGSLAVARLGSWLHREERWPFAFLLGSAMLSGFVFVLCVIHQARWQVLLAAAAAAAIWAWKSGSLRTMNEGPRFDPVPRTTLAVFLLLFLPFSFAYWTNSMAPEISPDGSSYHLGWVKRYAEAGGFVGVETSMYSLLSQGVEMLFLCAFVFGEHSSAAMVHWAFLLCLIWLMVCFGRRIGKPGASLAAAIFVYASPVVCVDGSSAYVDLATAAIGFGLFYLLYLWDLQDQPTPLLIAAGLLGGFTYATKYTAAIMAIWAAFYVLLRSRSKLKDVAVFSAMTLLLASPWMLRNAVLTGNPLAPFFNGLFPNATVHIIFEKQYSEWLREYDVKNKWELPLEVTVRGLKTAGILGYLFLLSPLALLAARRRDGRLLLTAALFALAPFPLNVGTRFLIPALPFVSMALALAIDLKLVLFSLMLAHAFLGWPRSPGLLRKTTLPGLWSWHAMPWKPALRIVKEDQFLGERSSAYRRAREVDRLTEPGSKILGQNGYAEAYSDREMLVSYQSAQNEVLMDIFYTGMDDSRWPRLHWVYKLPQPVSTRRMRLVQTEEPVNDAEQWNINELRFFGPDGSEIPRDTTWKLRANPNPWDVQFAFDNSPVTRWRSWQQAAPGMYFEVDFGSHKNVARVEIHSSFDNANCKARLMIERNSGILEEAGIQPDAVEVNLLFWMRREASRELLDRGVKYLLFGPDEYGGKDLMYAQREWGVKRVGGPSGKWLFKIEPYTKDNK